VSMRPSEDLSLVPNCKRGKIGRCHRRLNRKGLHGVEIESLGQTLPKDALRAVHYSFGGCVFLVG